MNCTECRKNVQRYLDNDLSASERVAFEQAQKQCPDCANLLASEQALRNALQNLPAPTLSGERKSALLRSTIIGNEPSPNRRSANATAAALTMPWSPAVSLAAGMLLGVALTLAVLPKSSTPDQLQTDAEQRGQARESEALGNVQLQVAQETVLRLKISSASAMEQVEFAIDLPAGLEFTEYPSVRQLRWSGRLAAGVNYLPLPVRALRAGSGKVTATVADTSGQRTFAIQYNVIAETGENASTRDHTKITAADSTRTS